MSGSFQAVTILFLYIALGWVGVRTLLSQEMMSGLNRFVYYFAVPALLFNAASKLSLTQLLATLPLTAFFAAALVTGLIAVVGCRVFFATTSGAQLTARALNTTFANYAYMGIPVVSALLGDVGYAAIITIILAGNLVLIGGAQVLFQGFEKNSGKNTLGQRVWLVLQQSLLKSPIFLSTVAGLIFSGAGLVMPDIPDQVLSSLGATTVPLALFCLGAGLQFRLEGSSLSEISWLIVIKLFAHPAVTFFMLLILGITDPVWVTALVMMTALPTGALAHVVTSHHGVFARETSHIVTLSTLFSLLTLPVWITIVSGM
ncbi:AEC family transporter [Parendozoicomonas sp. Alg238-R29]|uniref:AEC family transporter n=1 Tax=Parendozoicomonas sp. Alg238-R29 TaxID=2993446 RepID=UPI00248EDE29|nr:AEC family transporter [Parendozoicomonas sp. Alg238-R29]